MITEEIATEADMASDVPAAEADSPLARVYGEPLNAVPHYLYIPP
jgi:hypothetical protein